MLIDLYELWCKVSQRKMNDVDSLKEFIKFYDLNKILGGKEYV